MPGNDYRVKTQLYGLCIHEWIAEDILLYLLYRRRAAQASQHYIPNVQVQQMVQRTAAAVSAAGGPFLPRARAGPDGKRRINCLIQRVEKEVWLEFLGFRATLLFFLYPAFFNLSKFFIFLEWIFGKNHSRIVWETGPVMRSRERTSTKLWVKMKKKLLCT